MKGVGANPLLLTDSDVDALTFQFLNSDYAADLYADWPLDRRLDGFLRHRGLTRVADDGDAYNVLIDRVMTYISGQPREPTRRAAVN